MHLKDVENRKVVAHPVYPLPEFHEVLCEPKRDTVPYVQNLLNFLQIFRFIIPSNAGDPPKFTHNVARRDADFGATGVRVAPMNRSHWASYPSQDFPHTAQCRFGGGTVSSNGRTLAMHS